jgi:hypothetical protein
VKITDRDRELAAELVELLTDGAGDDRTVKCVAVILASHRASTATPVGRCGARSNPIGRKVTPLHCDLPAGHDGWHQHGNGTTSVATEWSA